MNNSVLDRRRFLQLCAATPAFSLSPLTLAQKTKNSPILLLVELKGGNDGLNTLIPYEDGNYYKLRPNIGIKQREVLKLGNGMGMHPSMESLLPMWQEGDMSWVQGVGYPEPNRSHFRSIDIWETGAASDEYLNDGWLAQLYKENAINNQLDGITIGSDSGPLIGDRFNSLLMQDRKSFIALTKQLKDVEKNTKNDALAHILKVQNNVKSNAQLVTEKLEKAKAIDIAFPKGKFAKQLKTTAQIITSGIESPIYKVELGSFDTHNNQLNRHQKLLKELSEGLNAFSSVMKKVGRWDDVLIVTYSEFGRRTHENKSKGTDHGTAAPHFALGGRVKGGVYKGMLGVTPSLTDLDNNDLKFTTDFRAYYNTIASQWMNVKSPWADFGELALIET